jgi:hypothetical protein
MHSVSDYRLHSGYGYRLHNVFMIRHDGQNTTLIPPSSVQYMCCAQCIWLSSAQCIHD